MDSKGQNFLHLAILKQDVEAVIFLLSVKVDVNSKVKNPTLNTALHYAIKGGSEILVRHLVSGGEGRGGEGGCNEECMCNWLRITLCVYIRIQFCTCVQTCIF